MSASQFCKQLSLPAHRLHHSQATSAKRGQTPSSKHHLYPTAVLQHWEEVISPSQEQQPRDACLRAIRSINTLQFETENSPRITVPSGYWHMQKVPAHSSWALWHGHPWAWKASLQKLCVSSLQPCMELWLHTYTEQDREGVWVTNSALGSGKNLPPSFWPSVSPKQTTPPSNHHHSPWTKEKRCARITLPSHHLTVMLSTNPVHLQSAMEQPQSSS